MRRPPLVVLLAVAAALVAAPSAAAFTLAQLPGPFAQPVHVSGPPGDPTRVLVVEQGGRIQLVKNGVKASVPYLDIAARVDTDGEEGLLSMAFPSTSRFYVLFNENTGTDGSDIVVERYNVAAGGDAADPTSAVEILRIPHRVGENHNGGQLQMGPDGNLWISTGDGGGLAVDSDGDAQDPNRLLGKILRIAPREDGEYDIPANNPYAGGGGAREVWATGLRNPWRFSFDRGTGDMLIGDVGEGTMEEIDHAPAPSIGCGANFGWPWYEGTAEIGSGAKPGTHHAPIITHTRSEGWRAIAGGYVIRDQALAEAGKYVYGDYFVDQLWLYDFATGTKSATTATVESLSGFGEDGVGRVYATSLEGTVHRLQSDTGTNSVAPPLVPRSGCGTDDGGENPSTPLDPLTPPLGGGNPSQPAAGPPAQAPRPLFGGRRRQRALRKRRVVARVRCDVACGVTVGGRLTIGPRRFRLAAKRAQLAPNRTRTLSVRLSGRAVRAARRALRRGARVRVVLTLRATGANGRTARRSITVTVVR